MNLDVLTAERFPVAALGAAVLVEGERGGDLDFLDCGADL